ncbi:hypothetical protein GN958_ATG09534 [Phytophthora infestans]|uniref:Uncharacterized protein n=1 Tax=Phytophthora infestans TaxID=4787 RepID=A0A8S9UQE0_PHYIN|nr:hypothetical protein GN958_ATG09534 [Phytophthora infestans]
MGLQTGAVTTRRSGNVYFHEKFTVANDYIRQLLLNMDFSGGYELVNAIPVVPITSTLEARLFPEAGSAPDVPAATKSTNLPPEKEIGENAEPVGVVAATPGTELQPAGVTNKKKKRKRQVSSSSEQDSSNEYQP